MIFQELDNGDLIYPTKGNPPKDIKGYIRDVGDPYVLHLDYQDCKYRKDEVKITPCKKRYPFKWCELKVIVVNAKICQNCQERCI